MLFRIDATGDEGRRDLPGVAGEFGRTALYFYPLGEGMHVDDAIQAIVGCLQLHEIDDGAEIIAEMQIARRLDA
jgi:hypothetical protein